VLARDASSVDHGVGFPPAAMGWADFVETDHFDIRCAHARKQLNLFVAHVIAHVSITSSNVFEGCKHSTGRRISREENIVKLKTNRSAYMEIGKSRPRVEFVGHGE
jgi:hypothetical protein